MYLILDKRHNTKTKMSENELRDLINGVELERIRINKWETGLYGLSEQQLQNNDYSFEKLIDMLEKEDYKIKKI